MSFKPFRPPSLKVQNDDIRLSSRPSEPIQKRRRLSPNGIDGTSGNETVIHTLGSREPLKILPNDLNPDNSNSITTQPKYFQVLWRKFTQKKNKTWDDDGYMSIKNGQATLHDGKGKIIGQSAFSRDVTEGALFSLAGRDVEVSAGLSSSDFQAAVGSTQPAAGINNKQTTVWERALSSSSSSTPTMKDLTKPQRQAKQQTSASNRPALAAKNYHVSEQRIPFKQPLKVNTVIQQGSRESPTPRHDPNNPGAIVFQRPKTVPAGNQLVDVVLDPMLGKHLREHQKDGVKFLYECVMGLRECGEGCILADDMGLGKTLQTIALLWTLIKQNPVYKAEPVVKKALIVCPVSLIQNWKKEFRKWLGRDRLGVMTFGDKGSRLSMFDGKNFKVMIVGYERLRSIAEDLTRGAGIDIVVCDEGHRLKTLQNKSAKAIESLNTTKRIILSGTPIQNDLSEFFAMANFVNDGCLGSYKSFVKTFENPILKSRQPNATEEDVERGQDANEDLAQTTSKFILRRTADILSQYLPPKSEYVLFCKPTQKQAELYRAVLRSSLFQNALGNRESALQLITILKKLCNSPALMRPDRGNDESTSSNTLSLLTEELPPGMSRLFDNRFSSKIRLLDELLLQIKTNSDDKVILVSNYTSTLNLIAQLLDNSGGRYLRLDGSVAQGKRQSLVDEFNAAPASSCFAFLLSAKAGGVGLNLIGANRLILFDVDWNPATDDQAMARIHREGQKKPCHIYRFLIKGGLEERIWQRQVVKRGLADSIMDGSVSEHGAIAGGQKKGTAAFSLEELRDLFRLDEESGLRTHELIGCPCKGQGKTSRPETTVEIVDIDEFETDEDNEGPVCSRDIACIRKASSLTDSIVERQERLIANGEYSKHDRAQKQMEHGNQALMRFEHLDTSGISGLHAFDDLDELTNLEAIVDDQCLMNVLRLGDDIIPGQVAYMFKKTSTPSAKPQPQIIDVPTDAGEA